LLSRFLFWLHRNQLARPHGFWLAHKIQRFSEAKNILVYGNYQNEALDVKSEFDKRTPAQATSGFSQQALIFSFMRLLNRLLCTVLAFEEWW
jgi:hypothetical protein